jgi:hypothetical protein
LRADVKGKMAGPFAGPTRSLMTPQQPLKTIREIVISKRLRTSQTVQ